MEDKFSRACTEVLEVLKYLPQNEFKKIPLSEIEFLENNKDPNYKFVIDEGQLINDLDISKTANVMIIVLWKKYFANEVQKEKLDKILDLNKKKVEEIRKEKYSYDKLFENRKNSLGDVKINEEVSLTVCKNEKWYKKIYKFFRKIFG